MGIYQAALTWLGVCSASLVASTEDERALGYPDQRKIARDSHGHLYVAYRRKYRIRGLHRHHIFVAKSIDHGASWVVLNNGTPIERVSDDTQRVPAIAIDAHDTIHIVWYGNDPRNTGENQRQIKYSCSHDYGMSWSNWLNIAEVDGYKGQSLWQEHPIVAVVGDDVFIVWQGLDADTNVSQVKIVKSIDGGQTWGAWRNVEARGSHNRSRPTLVATNDRLHILAYGDFNGVQQIMWTSSADGGDTWTPWAPVAACRADQRHVSAAVDSSGLLHIVWRQANAVGRSQIHYATYDGHAWSLPVVASASEEKYQFFPSVTIDDTDTVWVAWTETAHDSSYPKDAPKDGRIVYISKPKGGLWNTSSTIPTRRNNGIYATLRSDRNRNSDVDLIWLEYSDGPLHHIYYCRLK